MFKNSFICSSLEWQSLISEAFTKPYSENKIDPVIAMTSLKLLILNSKITFLNAKAYSVKKLNFAIAVEKKSKSNDSRSCTCGFPA